MCICGNSFFKNYGVIAHLFFNFCQFLLDLLIYPQTLFDHLPLGLECLALLSCNTKLSENKICNFPLIHSVTSIAERVFFNWVLLHQMLPTFLGLRNSAKEVINL